MTAAVLDVAGNLADEYRLGVPRTLAEHGLGRSLIERAAVAGLHGFAQRFQRATGR
jgi:hypothetical protein